MECTTGTLQLVDISFKSKCRFVNTCLALEVTFDLSLYKNDVICSFLRLPRPGAIQVSMS